MVPLRVVNNGVLHVHVHVYANNTTKGVSMESLHRSVNITYDNIMQSEASLKDDTYYGKR